MPTPAHETDNAIRAYQEKQAAERAAKEAAEAEARAAAEAKENEGKSAEELAAEEEVKRISDEKAEADRIEAERIAVEQNKEIEIDYDKIDLDKVIEKKTQGKFKGFKEIEDQLNREPEKSRYTDAFIEKYEEAVKRGVKPEVFLKTQTTDFTKLNEIEKVKQEMLLNNPELSPEDVSAIIEDKYKLNEDEYDERTVRVSKANLKIDAAKAEKSLLQWQVQAIETPIDLEAKKAAQLAEEKALSEREFKARWEKDATEELGKFKELKVKIGEREQDVLSYQPDKSEMDFIQEVVRTPDKIWSLFRNKDGTTNISKLIEGVALLKSAGNMTPKMAAAMKAAAIEEYIKEKKNVDFSSGSKNQQQQSKDGDSIRALAKDLL